MRVIICGGRAFVNRHVVTHTLDELRVSLPITSVAHGGASGVDTVADLWARPKNLPVRTFLPEWKKYGAVSSLSMRNQRMLDEFAPAVVIAFPGGDDIAELVAAARRRDVRVLEVDHAGEITENWIPFGVHFPNGDESHA